MVEISANNIVYLKPNVTMAAFANLLCRAGIPFVYCDGKISAMTTDVEVIKRMRTTLRLDAFANNISIIIK